jgi:aminoglycoside 6'-N-acetyltransferase
MRLRPATPADDALLRRWDRQPHVMAASGSDAGEEDRTEILTQSWPWWEAFIAEADGRPVGFLQIIDPALEPSHYWGDVEPDLRAIDIWIGEAADLGRGHGSAMMRLALAHCFNDPAVKAVLLDPLVANVRVHPFYRRLGFREVGRRMFGHDYCIVYRLERADWQPEQSGV